MKRERWQQVDALLKSALERPAAEREEFLARACAGDDELRREVESLVAHDEAESFLPTKPMAAFGAVAADLLAAAGARARQPQPPSPRANSLSSAGSIDEGRFVPGDLLAERYRVVGLLGRGGMGEVYRADDLKLKQAVALKFLPERLSGDGAALARFYQEVSVARQISHRNVCRVYDIGEASGLHFISMEYVRGEELSSALKRFGRLPHDKATDIARQLCAGLAAIHEKGVLHRDLKPANVMIDERGDVRITDFGLAALADEVRGREATAGTPAYMSPEQLAGGELSVRSDIYALGLVAYELFTGRRAFDAGSLDELLRLRASTSTPPAPSSLVKDIDPLVERVIERCLEREPERRPASALQVAAALPGGDPIAAALAAGETPSPEMVAAAPKIGSLRPAVALALLAGVILSLLALFFVSQRVVAYNVVPFERPAEALADRAAALVRRLGYADAPVDTAHGLSADIEYYRHVERRDQSVTRWERLKSGRPALVTFWYRHSPRYLEPQIYFDVTPTDPAPHELSGSASVLLDTEGRLLEFHAVPPQVDEPNAATTDTTAATNTTGATNTAAPSPAAASAPPPDWALLFQEAGLDPSRFTPSAPRWTPPVYADARAAWEGVYPEQPDVPLRVEAAGYGGRPVYFQLVGPWAKPYRMEPYQRDTRLKVMTILIAVVLFAVLLAGVWLARRNFRLGLGDRRGAFKMALFVFVTTLLSSLIGASHVPALGEIWLLGRILMESLVLSGVLWLLYIALEPYVRRRTPHRIISWNRLMAGDWRDPLIGRDVLVGVLLGVWVVLVSWAGPLAGAWLGIARPLEFDGAMASAVLGFRNVASMMLGHPFHSLLQGLGFTFLLLLFSLLLRGERRAAVALWALFMCVVWLGNGAHLPAFVVSLTLTAAYIFVAARLGLLAIAVAQFSLFLSEFYPFTTDLSAWHAGAGIFAAAVLLALAAYGFYVSLGGQPLLKRGLLEE